MTAIHRQTHALRPLPPPRDAHGPALARLDVPLSLESLTLSWEILPDVPGIASFIPPAATLTQARLVMVFGGHTVGAFLELTLKGVPTPTRSPLLNSRTPATLSLEQGGGAAAQGGLHLVHIHAAGVLTATIDAGQDRTPRVLYARTPLLMSLGVPGGAYDRPAAGWETEFPPVASRI